jgi:hypothetical protein
MKRAFAERWVRSVEEDCLPRLILFGEVSLKRALTEFIAHYHSERPHQGKENLLLFPLAGETDRRSRSVMCREVVTRTIVTQDNYAHP